jgi:hypothetical protein
VSTNNDGTFDNRRFHWGPLCRPLTRYLHTLIRNGASEFHAGVCAGAGAARSGCGPTI